MPQMPKLQGEQECSGHREEPREGHRNEDLPGQGAASSFEKHDFSKTFGNKLNSKHGDPIKKVIKLD